MSRGGRVLATLLCVAAIVAGSARPGAGGGAAVPDGVEERLCALVGAMLALDRCALEGEPDARLASCAVYRLCRARSQDELTQRGLLACFDELFPRCALTALDPSAAPAGCIRVRGETIELRGTPPPCTLTLTAAEHGGTTVLRGRAEFGGDVFACTVVLDGRDAVQGVVLEKSSAV